MQKLDFKEEFQQALDGQKISGKTKEDLVNTVCEHVQSKKDFLRFAKDEELYQMFKVKKFLQPKIDIIVQDFKERLLNEVIYDGHEVELLEKPDKSTTQPGIPQGQPDPPKEEIKPQLIKKSSIIVKEEAKNQKEANPVVKQIEEIQASSKQRSDYIVVKKKPVKEKEEEKEMFQKASPSQVLEDYLYIGQDKNVKDMPDCAEKQIITLLNDIESVISQGLNYGKQKIQQNLEQINNKINDEKINSFDTKLTIQKIEALTSSIDFSQDISIPQVIKNFKQLLKQIRVLDVSIIKSLLKEANIAATYVKDKDIILLMGATGSGKSTTIHYLAGSKMRLVEFEGGIQHIQPDADPENEELSKVKSSYLMKSETKFITAVNINLQQRGIKQKGNIVLCDTPGFEDSNGPEVDIANCVGLIKAVQQSKTARIVILISAKDIGNRLEGIRKISHQIVRMVTNIQGRFDNIGYIFTRYTDDTRQLLARIENLKESLAEADKYDVSFVSVIDDLIQKLTELFQPPDEVEHKKIFFIDPLKEQEISQQYLAELMYIEPIKDPSTAFRQSFSVSSIGRLQDWISYCQQYVTWNVYKQNTSFPQINYKLNILKDLQDLLSQPSLSSMYYELKTFIRDNLKMEYESASQDFFDSISNNALQLTEEDIQNYEKLILKNEQASVQLQAHIQLPNGLKDQFKEDLGQEIRNLSSQIQEFQFDDFLIVKILKKVYLLATKINLVDGLDRLINQIIQAIYEKQITLEIQFENYAQEGDFEQCSLILQQLQAGLEQLDFQDEYKLFSEKYLEQQNKKKGNSLLEFASIVKKRNVKILQEFLDGFVDQVKDTLKRDKLKNNNINEINKQISNLTNAKACKQLHYFIPLSVIDDQIYDLEKMIQSRYEKYSLLILKQIKEYKFSEVKTFYDEILQLLKIRIASIRLKKDNLQFIQMIGENFQQILSNGESLLEYLDYEQREVDFEQLNISIKCFEEILWIRNYDVKLKVSKIKDYKNIIGDYVYTQKLCLQDATSILDNIDEIPKFEKTYKILLKILTCIQDIDDDTKAEIQKANSQFEDQKEDITRNLKELLENRKFTINKKIDYLSLEKYYLYIQEFSKISREGGEIFYEFKKYIEEYKKFINKQTDDIFNQIKTETLNQDQKRLYIDNLDNICQLFYVMKKIARQTTEISKLIEAKKYLEINYDHVSDLKISVAQQYQFQNFNTQQQINNALTKSKQLQQLDEFSQQGKTFSSINRDLIRSVQQNSPSGVKEFIDLFNTKSYSKLYQSIKQIEKDENKIFEEVMNVINETINQEKISIDLIMKNNLDLKQKIEQLDTVIVYLTSLKNGLKELVSQTINEQIKQIVEEIVKKVKDKINQIPKLIEEGKIKKVYDIIKQIKSIGLFIQEEKEFLNQIDFEEIMELIKRQEENVNTQIMKQLQQIADENNQSLILIDPAKADLTNEILESQDDMIQQYTNQLKERIINTLSVFLDIINSKPGLRDRQKATQELEKQLKVVKVIEFQQILQNKVKMFLEKIQSQLNEEQQKLNQISRIEKIEELIDKYETETNKSFSDEIESQIRQQIFKKQELLSQSIENAEFEYLQKTWTGWIKFKTHFDSKKAEKFMTVNSQGEESFKNNLIDLEQQNYNKVIKNIQDSKYLALMQNITFFIHFNEALKQKDELTQFLPLLEDHIKGIQKQVEEMLSSQQQDFEYWKDNQQFEKIGQFLKNLKALELDKSFFTRAQDPYKSLKEEYDAYFKVMIERIQNISNDMQPQKYYEKKIKIMKKALELDQSSLSDDVNDKKIKELELIVNNYFKDLEKSKNKKIYDMQENEFKQFLNNLKDIKVLEEREIYIENIISEYQPGLKNKSQDQQSLELFSRLCLIIQESKIKQDMYKQLSFDYFPNDMTNQDRENITKILIDNKLDQEIIAQFPILNLPCEEPEKLDNLSKTDVTQQAKVCINDNEIDLNQMIQEIKGQMKRMEGNEYVSALIEQVKQFPIKADKSKDKITVPEGNITKLVPLLLKIYFIQNHLKDSMTLYAYNAILSLLTAHRSQNQGSYLLYNYRIFTELICDIVALVFCLHNYQVTVVCQIDAQNKTTKLQNTYNGVDVKNINYKEWSQITTEQSTLNYMTSNNFEHLANDDSNYTVDQNNLQQIIIIQDIQSVLSLQNLTGIQFIKANNLMETKIQSSLGEKYSGRLQFLLGYSTVFSILEKYSLILGVSEFDIQEDNKQCFKILLNLQEISIMDKKNQQFKPFENTFKIFIANSAKSLQEQIKAYSWQKEDIYYFVQDESKIIDACKETISSLQDKSYNKINTYSYSKESVFLIANKTTSNRRLILFYFPENQIEQAYITELYQRRQFSGEIVFFLLESYISDKFGFSIEDINCCKSKIDFLFQKANNFYSTRQYYCLNIAEQFRDKQLDTDRKPNIVCQYVMNKEKDKIVKKIFEINNSSTQYCDIIVIIDAHKLMEPFIYILRSAFFQIFNKVNEVLHDKQFHARQRYMFIVYNLEKGNTEQSDFLESPEAISQYLYTIKFCKTPKGSINDPLQKVNEIIKNSYKDKKHYQISLFSYKGNYVKEGWLSSKFKSFAKTLSSLFVEQQKCKMSGYYFYEDSKAIFDDLNLKIEGRIDKHLYNFDYNNQTTHTSLNENLINHFCIKMLDIVDQNYNPNKDKMFVNEYYKRRQMKR